jgi:hypothetical protein
MDEIYLMLNLMAIVLTIGYGYVTVRRGEPYFHITLSLIVAVVWYTTGWYANTVNAKGYVATLLYDAFGTTALLLAIPSLKRLGESEEWF